jgi:glycosyltransferase 2 family protein
MKIPKFLANGLKLLFTILLLFLVFQSVELSKIKQNLKTLDLGLLTFLLMACWIGQLLCSERWRIFAAALQMRDRYLSFVQMYFVGMFFNIGLPSLIGGDFVKAFIVSRKSGKPFQIGLASVFQDRAAGLISLLLYGSLAILLCPISWRGFPLRTVYLVCWIFVAIGLGLIAKGEVLYCRFIVSQHRTLGQKILKILSEFHQALGMSRLSRREILWITLYSFANTGLILWVLKQVTVAAGHPVSMVAFSALFPLVILATMLPVTLSGIGVREWFYIEALSLAGIPREQGLMISLATSALLLICNLGGIAFLPAVTKKLRPRAQDFQKNSQTDATREHQNQQGSDII